MANIAASAVEVEEWLAKSPTFVQDLHNLDAVERHVNLLEHQLGRRPNLAEVADYINSHSSEYHWLAAPNEEASRQASRNAAARLTGTELHKPNVVNHAAKPAQDRESAQKWNDLKKSAVRTREEAEHKAAIRAAEQHISYYESGPGVGRPDWSRTAEVRRQRLAALGVK